MKVHGLQKEPLKQFKNFDQANIDQSSWYDTSIDLDFINKKNDCDPSETLENINEPNLRHKSTIKYSNSEELGDDVDKSRYRKSLQAIKSVDDILVDNT